MNRTEEKMDTIKKEFIAFPDIAADVVNMLLYQGHALTDARNLNNKAAIPKRYADCGRLSGRGRELPF